MEVSFLLRRGKGDGVAMGRSRDKKAQVCPAPVSTKILNPKGPGRKNQLVGFWRPECCKAGGFNGKFIKAF